MFQDSTTKRAATSHLIASLKSTLAKKGLTGRQAGVLLVFASGPTTGIGTAITTAKTVIGIVKKKVKGFSSVRGSGYWSGSGNNFRFEVFFFSKSVG
jgi:hypothetical protein